MQQAAAQVAASRRKRRGPLRPAAVPRAPQGRSSVASGPARRRRSHIASFVKAMGVAATIAALAMVTLSQRVLIAQDGLAISDLERKIQAERSQKQQLEMALLVLESPGRIQRQASERFGMIAPEHVSYMQIPLARPSAGGATAAPPTARSRRVGRAAGRQGILATLLEKVAGQVQLLPLGNVGMPTE